MISSDTPSISQRACIGKLDSPRDEIGKNLVMLLTDQDSPIATSKSISPVDSFLVHQKNVELKEETTTLFSSGPQCLSFCSVKEKMQEFLSN